jgi:sec-independent protein translocase protein TatA
MGIGTPELIIVLIIVVLVFGSTKLPQLGDGLGRAIKNFKRSVAGQNELEVSPKAKKDKAEIASDAPSSGGEKKTTG